MSSYSKYLAATNKLLQLIEQNPDEYWNIHNRKILVVCFILLCIYNSLCSENEISWICQCRIERFGWRLQRYYPDLFLHLFPDVFIAIVVKVAQEKKDIKDVIHDDFPITKVTKLVKHFLTEKEVALLNTPKEGMSKTKLNKYDMDETRLNLINYLHLDSILLKKYQNLRRKGRVRFSLSRESLADE